MIPTAIVDFGLGNLFSVATAARMAGLDCSITSDPEVVRRSDAIILPGVGAFPSAMKRIDDTGLASVISDAVRREVPLLGVCLGLQLLFERSDEFGERRGLGLLPGRVVRFPAATGAGNRLKVPHIGWNQVRWNAGAFHVPEGGDLPDYMYFVHSYFVVPSRQSDIAAMATYADVPFCCAVEHDRIWGVQCHPERSGEDGVAFYRRFARMAAGTRSSVE